MRVSLTMNDKQVSASLRLPRALVLAILATIGTGIAEAIRCEQRVAALQSQLDKLERHVNVQTANAGGDK